MPAGVLVCCCLPKCPNPSRCGVFDVQICPVGACSTLDPVRVTVGPGSTIRMSMDAVILKQDLKLSSTAAAPWTPKDPGDFAAASIDQPCSPFAHPYTPSGTETVAGRKVRKTVLKFTDAVFQWLPVSPGSCSYGWSARRVMCQVTRAAEIVSTGTPGAAGAVSSQVECDELEDVLCDLTLALIGDILWCPSDEGQFTTLVGAVRTDGQPFEPLVNEDWDDEFHAEDPGTEFPGVDLDVAMPTDRSLIEVRAAWQPAGALGRLSAMGSRLEMPESVSVPVTSSPQTAYIGFARQRASRVTGSLAMSVVNTDCVEPPPCATCLEDAFPPGAPEYSLGALGTTVTIVHECVDEADACEAFGVEEPDVTVLELRLKCVSGSFLAWQWYSLDAGTGTWSEYAGDPPWTVVPGVDDCHVSFLVDGAPHEPDPDGSTAWSDPQSGGAWVCSVDPPAANVPAGTYVWDQAQYPGENPAMRHTVVVE